jgi:hypothetical protein
MNENEYATCPNRELFVQKLDALGDAIALKFEANQVALELQAKVYDKHFEALNNEYKRIDTFQHNMEMKFTPLDVYAIQHRVLADEIKELRSFKDNLNGRIAMIGLATGLASSVVVGLVVWFLTGR